MNKMLRNERTERSMFLGTNWRRANVKISMVHDNNPDAAFMDGIEKTERKSSVQQCTGTTFAHHTS